MGYHIIADSIRDGFSILDSKLYRIAENPQYLESERTRFDRPPSILSSDPLSGTETESNGSDSPLEEVKGDGNREMTREFLYYHGSLCLG